ncbi:MAG TPA: DUF523 domain-containing protein [Thermoclostridium caenicola]|uniref:Uncharacterized conserved protein YbbK, DUF523 family n=1 Tax=Thermoclostridium caenicola TaxID=659425 RepID=A0A1M6AKW0_9FIRM|nr:DUF523 domain-containing protein [Thermoclostridium caenicola]SHI37144.1 Uncharacterized conserved protein YbbK, DUF523 family [Thermoclostridium caenicola]HOK44203.1 DUF523 domain-containing protein [Thermoclostridium caenicola]HOL84646.1 DUF523 domain-containing protein [Thermoclostridium caenicola]HOP73045.1 DUF523 domain-containing protein [Thermoclostridium caenicola]HPO76076.1 DUF523 domain-containing protein [Thermoclostridium caenicola]
MCEKYLVSACLAGENCRYDGKDCRYEAIVELVRQGKAIPVCPEQLGGLPTPRCPSEIVRTKDGTVRVINREGRDCTREFLAGAQKTLELAKAHGVRKAILKSKSPSCGCGQVYDGTFSGKLTKGYGITAKLLMENQIEVCTENDVNLDD